MSFMITRSGKKFFPLAPKLEDLCIHDIAHALSNICRFAGHTSDFYSVAQHSVYVAQTVELAGGSPPAILAALLHDAPEAYLIDLPTPIKAELPQYRAIEALWWDMVCKRWMLPRTDEIESLIKMADERVFYTEARDLMNNPKEWREREGRDVIPIEIVPVPPREANHMFLSHFQKCKAAL